MKNDITNRNDIETLVNTFYEKVKIDSTIGHFFTEVVKVNWDIHLPRMYDFWDNILFHTGAYIGNPMQRHRHIHQQQAIENEHFDYWVQLFKTTVDELFEGENATLIKTRAASIAAIMQVKVNA
jgi:hemoglobin